LKIVNLLVVIMTGIVLAYGTMDMPDWGDPNSPASSHISPKYITNAVEKTATPNIVTAVLADYRGYDTLGETAVIFSAGMACILLLRRKRKK
jgi:multicomponent Na+:H+ antiporter subunit B